MSTREEQSAIEIQNLKNVSDSNVFLDYDFRDIKTDIFFNSHMTLKWISFLNAFKYVTHSVKMSHMSPNAILSYGQFNVENVINKIKKIKIFLFLFKIFSCMVNL